MRFNAKLIGLVVPIDLRRAIDDHGFVFADTLEPMENIRRDLQKNEVKIPHEKLIDLFVGRGSFSPIIQNDLHHPLHDYKIINLLFMVMPCFYGPGISGGHIYLPEFDEKVIIGPEHFHEAPPLVGNHSQLFGFDAINHKNPLRCYDGFVKSPSVALRFPFVAAAYHPSTPLSGGFARRVPRNAGELFTKPSLWQLFTRSSTLYSI
jgi:hypothetical protein